jgi:putative aldouronate transport system permease protein
MSLPEELEESAKIDGANDIVILFRIVIPISMPIIATLLLWIAVGHWNAWFDSLVYMTDAHKHVLMVVMRRIVLEGTNQMMEMTGGADDVSVNPESVKAAVVMVTTLPILVLYPFVQKYFVKGILVGSLKG